MAKYANHTVSIVSTGSRLVILFLVLALWATSAAVLGQDTAGLDLMVRESDYAPSVTITEHENRVVETFSVNNNVYMVKITPAAGPSYYLVDEDGSGDMAMSRGFSGIEQRVPQWVLLSW